MGAVSHSAISPTPFLRGVYILVCISQAISVAQIQSGSSHWWVKLMHGLGMVVRFADPTFQLELSSASSLSRHSSY